MFKTKTLWMFLLKAVILYGLLALPLPFYNEMYGAFYRSMATCCFKKFGDGGLVKFEKQQGVYTTRVVILNTKKARADGALYGGSCDINPRYYGYIPTILLISLIVASPVPRKRKLIALLVGLILLYALILFKQWIILLTLCDQGGAELGLMTFNSFQLKLLRITSNILYKSVSPVMYFTVAIWLLVTFRMEDLRSVNETIRSAKK